MNISGIRTQSGFYDYNTIKNNELRGQQIREARVVEQQESDAEILAETQASEHQDISAGKVQPDQGAIAFRQQYQPEATYELRGSQSSLDGLDIEKAISEMKKDQVLQQYQFFVGDSGLDEDSPIGRNNINFML
jgi:hypothetical protein